MDVFVPISAALSDRYVIEREVGRGGMATVFLARDVRHDRRVAVKVLDPELGAVLGAARFLAEIKVTANLQHPNLLPLFDSGEAAGLLYYVMPFVEGESLRARLDREKQLPVDEVIRIATAIASALEYAHGNGVVHRDLKPENILMQAGQPIVADFGIALAVSNAGGTRVTQTGLSLGTPQYMSPEQAMGDRVIDGRSDLYALGAITYEMLVGEPPHTGATSQAIIARLITERPRLPSESRSAVPPHVDVAVMRALEKLPADRWATAAEFSNALRSNVLDSATSVRYTRGAGKPSGPSRYLWPATTLLLAAALIALAAVHVRERPDEPLAARFAIALPEGRGLASTSDVAISPDGKAIAFATRDTAGDAALWVRRLDSLDAQRIIGTEDAGGPFWSPDSRSIGFFAGAKLKRVDLDGTAPVTLASTNGERLGGAWVADDQIVFERGDGVLSKVSARGGQPVAVTIRDTARAELNHTFPQSLSDGKHFLYRAISYRSDLSGVSVFVGSLDGGPGKLIPGTGVVWYAAPRYLLRANADGLRAVAFDPKTFDVVGDTLRVDGFNLSAGPLSLSSNGIAVQGIPSAKPRRTSLELLDRAGNTIRDIAPRSEKTGDLYYAIRLSPDGNRVAYEHHLGLGGGDLFVTNVHTGQTTRESFDPKNHYGFPAWSPDGKQLVYNTTRSGGGDLQLKTVGGSDGKLLGSSTTVNSSPSDWSHDGSTIIFDRISPGTQSDVWTIKADGRGSAKVLSSPANEMQGALSPDGRWLAYVSDEDNARFEVFVRPYPAGTEKWKISTEGGEAPRWRADGKELFFLAPARQARRMMAARIDATASFKWDTPTELFTRAIRTTSGFLRSGYYYDVAPDGKTFAAVIFNETPPTTSGQFIVTTNWWSGLRERKK